MQLKKTFANYRTRSENVIEITTPAFTGHYIGGITITFYN